MNRLLIRVGLGLAVYLSYSTLYKNPSFAVSLNFSDRYDLIQPEETPFVVDDFFFPSVNTQAEINNQSEPQNAPNITYYSNYNEYIDREIPDLLAVNNQPSLVASSSEVNEILSNPASNLQIQIGNGNLESDNLLGYITNALGGLRIDSLSDSSTVNPNVRILPQVSFQDIYEGLYEFDVDLENSTASGLANNQVPELFLITQESIRNYSSLLNASPYQSNPEAYSSSNPGGYRSNLSNSLYGNSTPSGNGNLLSQSTLFLSPNNLPSLIDRRSLRENNSSGNLSQRVEEVLAENTNVYGSTGGISEIELEQGYRFETASDKFQKQKSIELKNLERQQEQERRIREEKRHNLEMRLKQEQIQRDMRRKQQQIMAARARENKLRQQTLKQQQLLRQQQNTYGSASR